MLNVRSIYTTSSGNFPDPNPDGRGFVALTFDWSRITADGRNLVATEYEIYWCRVDITEGVAAPPPLMFNADGSVNTMFKAGDTAANTTAVHGALEGSQWVPVGTVAASYPGVPENNPVNINGGSKLPGYDIRLQRVRHDAFPDRNTESMLYFFVVAKVDGYQAIVSDIISFDYSQRLNRDLTINLDGTPYNPGAVFADSKMTWTLPQVAVSDSRGPGNTFPVEYKVYYAAGAVAPPTDSGSWVEIDEAAGTQTQRADGTTTVPIETLLTGVAPGSWIMVEIIAHGCAETKIVAGRVPV